VEAGSTSATLGWRLWALVPIVLLSLAVALVVSQGDRVIDLVGGNPPPDLRAIDSRPQDDNPTEQPNSASPSDSAR